MVGRTLPELSGWGGISQTAWGLLGFDRGSIAACKTRSALYRGGMSEADSTARPSLRFGRPTVAIPGPSIIPDVVLEAMARPMQDLYEGPVIDVAGELKERLPGLARTSGEVFIMTANGHGAWQMATSNTIKRSGKVLALESGRFATVWGQYTAVSGNDVELLPGDDRGPVDPAALEERLRADVNHEIEAVLCVHVDTASSVRNDIPALRRAIDAANHPALFMVDAIASMGCERFEMDEWGVDITVAGCQKGLMVPPGVSFVWASEKALAVSESADARIGYFDWVSRRSGASIYSYFAGTPPVAHLFGLRAAFDLVEEEGGWPAVWNRHTVMSDAVKAAVETWSTDGAIEFNIADPDHRANCVTTVRTGEVDHDELRRLCVKQAGLTLGLGIGDVPGFRIGHMGHLNPPMILGTLGTLEAALQSMSAPLGGSGVAAAAKVIAAHL